MKKKWLIYALIAFLLVDLLAGFGWVSQNYVFAAGGLYPKNAKTLDLRDKNLTLKDYRSISQRLPDCDILWNVPLSDGRAPSTQKMVAVTKLTEKDLELLGTMENLTTVDGALCQDYDQLYALKQQRPDLEVLYQVPIAGLRFAQDTIGLRLKGLTEEDVKYMAYLPELTRVRVFQCSDYDFLQELQRTYPQWGLTYTVALGQEEFRSDTTVIRVEDADYEQLRSGLVGLTALTELELINPHATADQLLELRLAYPNVNLHWSVRIGDTIVDQTARELDLSGTPIPDCEALERSLASLPNLEKLILSHCGLDNETLAAFRERQRGNYKVVWTVQLSEHSECRTDAVYFMPIQQGEYYFRDEHSENLKYCEDLVVLDLGHHTITNVDFLEYMPKLKYLILAHTEIRDISPIVHCQELIYLEVDWSTIQDYSPIAKLKKLEDLNLNRTYCDLTPILEMTWLKTLWTPGRGYAWSVKLNEALPNTRVVMVEPTTIGIGWRDLPNYKAQRDILGMPYMD